MKKTKKFLSILLATILILSLFPMSLAHASDSTITFSAETDAISAKAGDIVNVNINMTENSDLAAMTLAVNYDNTALKILSAETKNKFGYEEFNTAYADDQLVYLVASAMPTAVNGTIFTIQFEVLKDGCTEISLDIDELTDINFNAISHTTQSTKIHNCDKGDITEPTCTETGFTIYTCTCGFSYQADETEAKGHSFGDWTTETEATCTENGLEKRVCTACGETEDNELPANGHRYNSVVTEPTCIEAGFTTYTCDCGDSYIDDETEAKGHFFGDWTTETEATCTEDGIEKRVCTACGETEDNELPANGHRYNSVVTEPTCTEAGFTTYTCDCGDSYIDDETEAKGHSFVNGTCTVCGDENPDYYTFSIKEPSRTKIRNKDGIILHTEITGNAPVGSYVEWTSNNNKFNKTIMNDGDSLRVIANNKGDTTFTATLYDVNGNILATDSVELYSDSGFFQKIGGFFRSLFRATKIYDK